MNQHTTSTAIRIGYDASDIFIGGGIERYAREILRGVARNTEVTPVLIARTKHRAAFEDLLGECNAELIEGYPNNLALGNFLRPITRLIQRRWWTQLCSKVDLVHLTGHHWQPNVTIPFVATIHDLFPITMSDMVNKGNPRPVIRALEWQMEKARRIIVPSRFTASTIHELMPDTLERITVVPLAAGPEFVPNHNVAPLPTLLWYGRADERKNVGRMVQAYATLPASIRKQVSFTIVMGGIAEYRLEFAQQNAALLQVDGVRFLEPLSFNELVSTMQRCYGLVFCSTAEGFGLPVIEAMQSGCPVLTSHTTSMPEVGSNAVLYADPLSVTEIAAQMEVLCTNEVVRNELRVKGIEQARRFSWAKTVDATCSVYKAALL